MGSQRSRWHQPCCMGDTLRETACRDGDRRERHLSAFLFGHSSANAILSGDDNPNDSTNHALINKWEGTSDTFIVESEKYGEISRLLNGNLEALKAKLEYALDDRKRVRLKSVYGNYRIAAPGPGASNKLGQEFDVALSWDYTTSPTTFTLFGGLFFPDECYRTIPVPVGSGIVRSTDMIYILGLNLKVKF